MPFEITQTKSKSREIICKVGVLNLYKINIHHILTFMFRTKNQGITATFQEKFKQIHHKYSTGFQPRKF